MGGHLVAFGLRRVYGHQAGEHSATCIYSGDLQGAQVMLEQYEPQAGQWLTGLLEAPLGRGINLQIDVPAVAPILQRLNAIGWPLFRDVEDAWYRADEVEAGQRQFLVQDPDGYLVRLVERLGERPLQQA